MNYRIENFYLDTNIPEHNVSSVDYWHKLD